MSNLVKRLRIKAGMIEMGERIAWGSDSALMREAADALEMAAPAVQVEPVALCEDTVLSIAERTFSTEVDEQLASDIVQYAQRLHSLYTAPQPAEQKPGVTQLVEALTELCDEIDKHEIHAAISKTSISWFKRKARAALAAYRKRGE